MPENEIEAEGQEDNNEPMTNEISPENLIHPIQGAWKKFVSSVTKLLGSQLDDRPLDQYLKFRDTVIPFVQSQQFLDALQNAWVEGKFRPGQYHNALQMEIEAFSGAIEVLEATEEDNKKRKKALVKWLSRSSIITGSVKDILDNLPPEFKMALTLFKELIDLFTP